MAFFENNSTFRKSGPGDPPPTEKDLQKAASIYLKMQSASGSSEKARKYNEKLNAIKSQYPDWNEQVRWNPSGGKNNQGGYDLIQNK
jgi:hypothetical protein